jgi:hypothetical protein
MNETEKRIALIISNRLSEMNSEDSMQRGKIIECSKAIRNCFHEDSNAEMDALTDKNEDWAYDLLHGKLSQETQCLTVNCISDEINDVATDEFEPQWAEQDETYIQIFYRDGYGIHKRLVSDEELAHLLFGIFANFDCTGCCNAIEYVKVGAFAILIKVKSGRTYHS